MNSIYGLQVNEVTGHCYTGRNLQALAEAAITNAWPGRWVTYVQAKSIGLQVRKGSKGIKCILFSSYRAKGSKQHTDKAHKGKGSPKTYMKAFTLFNIAQCDAVQAENVA